jgi:DNA repair protein RecO (recombination protein O)
VAPVTTPAIVLSMFPYRETSRIVRLATRDMGLQSVIARGASRPRSHFGPALQGFSEGTATILPARSSDLHTLTHFEAERIRIGLAERLDRFASASLLSELMLQFAPASRHLESYDLLRDALAILEAAPAAAVEPLALRSLWRMVAVLGFSPELAACARCGSEPGAGAACFSPQDGGVLCSRCARGTVGSRLTGSDRNDLSAWLDSRAELPVLDDRHLAAHRRLLERYIRFHLAEGAPLPALTFWAARGWIAA